MRLIDRRGGGAPVDGGEPAGVAMGQHIHALAGLLLRGDLADQRQTMRADGVIDGDVLVAKLCGEAPGGGGAIRFIKRRETGARRIQRPFQVDCGRSRGDQRVIGGGERGVEASRCIASAMP
jgi:hypothetical protein